MSSDDLYPSSPALISRLAAWLTQVLVQHPARAALEQIDQASQPLVLVTSVLLACAVDPS
ncbi:hypothetical protein PAXRUDRAFT_14489 [Paxillus rubicundulus Ve08.2h10]|uniref:Unplaced genomic scaffold scaffold_736, whole genome shotgun sequence n=1 Tax=Paxillus rubicundulus Ve08.2h10 TaxID=930991 RepID=A0A0D0DA42_9AGAM|nr:hypothetical protein PAXRUDRAFT_14489 [Paxillus rubicundulus Ve08.2h10]